MTFTEFGKNVVELFKRIASSPLTIVAAILTVVIFTAVFYLIFKLLKTANAKLLILMFTLIMILGAFAFVFGMQTVNKSVYLVIPVVFILFCAFVYSIEIKRAIWSRAFKTVKTTEKAQSSTITDAAVKSNINEIIKALQNMSKNDIGALVVLSDGNIPTSISESGSTINAKITAALIESIFFPKTALHDGAMIINGNKIESAGCFLPLSQNENLPKELGTRHRAALGITEAIDVTVFVVSEETGIISIVNGGKITRYADAEMLRNEMNRYYSKILAKKEK